jgi:hypothetical protein
MGVVNKAWHAAHRLGARASTNARIAWHVAHAQNCSCRAMPATIRAEIERRGLMRDEGTFRSSPSPASILECSAANPPAPERR